MCLCIRSADNIYALELRPGMCLGGHGSAGHRAWYNVKVHTGGRRFCGPHLKLGGRFRYYTKLMFRVKKLYFDRKHIKF